MTKTDYLDDKYLIYGVGSICVFAGIYMRLLSGSYCNTNKNLCSKPVINNILDVEGIKINQIVQEVKCDNLPADVDTTYEKTSASTIGWIIIILTFILAVLLSLSTYVDGTKFHDKYDNYIIAFIGCLGLFLTFRANTQPENAGMYLLIMMVIFVISAFAFGFINKLHNNNTILKILVIVAIIIFFIAITSFKYIYNLQIVRAFKLSSSIFFIIAHLAVIIYMVVLLYNDDNSTSSKNPILYIIYIIAVLILSAQFFKFGSNIYECIWRTYKCNPKLKTSYIDDSLEVDIKCVATVNYRHDNYVFLVLGIILTVLANFVNYD